MKVITVKQQDLKDCGCCCLASIIKYYNGNVPLEKIRIDTYTNTNGTTAFHIIEAAKKYGFMSFGKRVSFNKLQEEVFPLIAHVTYENGFNHYIVIYKIYNSKILIMDPAKGKKMISTEEFKKIWDNIIIIFHPKNTIVNYPKYENIFKIFFTYLLKYKSLLFHFILYNILMTICLVFEGFYVSFALSASVKNRLTKIILVFILIFLIKKIVEIFKYKTNNKITYLLENTIMSDFNNRIFNLPLSYMQNRTPGEIISRVNELSSLKDLFSEIIISLFWDSILALSSLIILFVINTLFGFILLIFAIVYINIEVINGKYLYNKISEILEKDSEYNNKIIENIKNYESIVNLNCRTIRTKNLNSNLDSYNILSYHFNNMSSFLIFLKNLICDLAIFTITTIGILMFFNKKIEIYELVLIESFLNYFWTYTVNLLNVYPRYNYFKSCVEKISDFYSIKAEQNLLNGKFNKGDITFKNVSISYDNHHLVNANINTTFKYKSHTLLIGESGSGKSSLLKSLFSPQIYRGIIEIGNLNVKDISSNLLRKNILYVGQNENLFNDTIYNNIVLDRNISIKKVYDVCKLCLVDKIIMDKPLRFNTIVDNDLSNISGGERQKIILSRALAGDFEILILDEALSEVDYTSEINIINNIQKFFSNKTIIYVSHKDVSSCFKNIVRLDKTGGI